MPDYRGLYFRLFGAIADAVEELEQGRAEAALERLVAAEREAEEQYISEE